MTENVIWQPNKVSAKDRYRVLGQKGLVVWFTGLSGSGKSTIAVELEKMLNDAKKAVYLLDGDNIRHGINSDLEFTDKDRDENIRRIGEISALFCDAGVITLAAFISPFRKMRRFARGRVGENQFLEVYVSTDFETCCKRDPKGLYKKNIKNIAADDIADGDSGISPSRCRHRRHQLRKRRSQGDNGKTDKPLAHSEVTGNGRGSADCEIAALHNQNSAKHHQKQAFPYGKILHCSLFPGILFSGHHEKIAQICQKKEPENHALHKGNPASCHSESQQERRNRKHEGNLIMKRRTLDRHIGNYRRDSQYNQNV